MMSLESLDHLCIERSFTLDPWKYKCFRLLVTPKDMFRTSPPMDLVAQSLLETRCLLASLF